MVVKKRLQIGLQDQIVDNKEIEEKLEKRQSLKEKQREYRKVDKTVKGDLKNLNLSMPFRIGRFIIAESAISGKTVSFETAESSRINISIAE